MHDADAPASRGIFSLTRLSGRHSSHGATFFRRAQPEDGSFILSCLELACGTEAPAGNWPCGVAEARER